MAKDKKQSQADKQRLHNTETVDGAEPLPKKKSCSHYCVLKALTIIYTLIFFIVGAILLALGVIVFIAKVDYDEVYDSETIPSILAVIIGAVMIISAILGLVGACKDNVCLLKFFFAIVIIALIMQVIIGIVAFVFREKTKSIVNSQLNEAVLKYGEYDELNSAVDAIQQKFQCCGVAGPRDYDKAEHFMCATPNAKHSCSLPGSCCKADVYDKNPDCGLDIRRNYTASQWSQRGINVQGCSHEFLEWVENNLDIVGACALGFATLHVLAIFLIYRFILKIQDMQNLFWYRKRAYQI